VIANASYTIVVRLGREQYPAPVQRRQLRLCPPRCQTCTTHPRSSALALSRGGRRTGGTYLVGCHPRHFASYATCCSAPAARERAATCRDVATTQLPQRALDVEPVRQRLELALAACAVPIRARVAKRAHRGGNAAWACMASSYCISYTCFTFLPATPGTRVGSL
jgi:hypothetical protein